MQKKYAIFLIFVCGCGGVKKASFTDVPAIIDQTNIKRESRGLKKLVVSEELTLAAQSHVENMARSNRLRHILDGIDLEARVNKQGYKWFLIGENIACGMPNGGVVEAWMRSPGHRQNILNRDFKNIGVAIAFSDDGTPYYCQVFGADK